MDDNTQLQQQQEDTRHGDQISAAEATPSILPQDLTPPKSGEDGELVTKALRFLASASTETLGAIAVGLSACTYLVLGRIGLVLIGVVAGVVLHATWEGQNAGATEQARREKGLDVVRRILDLRNAKGAEEDNKDDAIVTGSSFEGFRPETSVALTELVEVSHMRKVRVN